VALCRWLGTRPLFNSSNENNSCIARPIRTNPSLGLRFWWLRSGNIGKCATVTWDLIADVGGTNMRLVAAAPSGSFGDRHVSLTARDTSLAGTVAQFVRAQSGPPERICVAAAGVVRRGAVVLTNSGMKFSESDLAGLCRSGEAKILNDFEAAAWSLASVEASDVQVLQGPQDLQSGARLILGTGTGLGVGGMIWSKGNAAVVSGEGGHVRISPGSNFERDVFGKVIELWPEVRMGQGCALEAEALLSGTGLPYFYRAILDVKGGARAPDIVPKNAGDIFAAAKAGSDRAAVAAVDLFRKYLGEVAGDLSMVLAAEGGVFIAGGVASANDWVFRDPRFLQAFCSGGRHTGLRARLPVYLYDNPNFGLIGGLNYLRNGG